MLRQELQHIYHNHSSTKLSDSTTVSGAHLAQVSPQGASVSLCCLSLSCWNWMEKEENDLLQHSGLFLLPPCLSKQCLSISEPK